MHEAEAMNGYLLQELAERYSVSCLGITTKQRGFYVTEEIDAVLEAAEPILRRYKTIICVGNSMGGYAALKYSRRFGATHVIAIAPTFSIDPHELDLPSDTHRKILTRSLEKYKIVPKDGYRGMGIRPADVSGQLAALFDPNESVDYFQLSRIARAVPQIEEIPVFHAGHLVYQMLSTPKLMWSLIQAMLESGAAGLRREVHQIKRAHADPIIQLLRNGAGRHPDLVLRALRSDRVQLNPERDRIMKDPLLGVVVRALYKRGRIAESVEVYDEYLARVANVSLPRRTGYTPGIREGERYLLLYPQGQVLVWSEEKSVFWFSNVLYPTDAKPVFVRVEGNIARLHIVVQGVEKPVRVEGDAPLTWSMLGSMFVLKAAGGYPTPGNNDWFVLAPEQPGEDASPLPISIPLDSPLFATRSGDWLSSVATRVEATVPAGPESRETKGMRWTRLLKLGAKPKLQQIRNQ